MTETLRNDSGGADAPNERREWLVTNGLGGYASGTVRGPATRRFHGLLVAAFPAPLGRWMLLNDLIESIRAPEPRPDPSTWTVEFRLEHGLPVWTLGAADCVLEKRIMMPRMQNTVLIEYRAIEASPHGAVLELRPVIGFRPHEAPFDAGIAAGYAVVARGVQYELRTEAIEPVLRFQLYAAREHELVLDGGGTRTAQYAMERARGYDAEGRAYSPGAFRCRLLPGERVTFLGSAESWMTIEALQPEAAWTTEHERRARLLETAHPAARAGFAADLVLAADDFVVVPAARVADRIQARAAGDEARTVIAGYHWFTDWGRDTMIALDGLLLVTGRKEEAGYILRTFAHHMRDGLIPNLFPEGEREGLYHTADATLWFFHAIDRYLQTTGDRATLDLLLPQLAHSIEMHRNGTHFGIGVDPADGLLRQAAPGLQLTWMDAKVDDWVVTPRRGKAVEINALYFNALCLLARWLEDAGDSQTAHEVTADAARLQSSFNERFWNPTTGCLFDVVDAEAGGDDARVRPNQIMAISLPHPVLHPSRWESVLQVVESELLTPFGLRTLSRRDPDYSPRYDGDLRARDAAYHQGTVWPWLLGPFTDAYLRVHPERGAEVAALLSGFASHLQDACAGTISEIFDAEPPHAPRGCVAQAWSVAEVLRGFVRAAEWARSRDTIVV